MESWELRGSTVELPEEIRPDSKELRVFGVDQIPNTIRSKLRLAAEQLKHIYRDASGKYFVLERYGSSYWICWPVGSIPHEAFSSSLTKCVNAPNNRPTTEEWNQLQFKELLRIWRDTTSKNATFPSIELNMRIPEAEGNVRSDVPPTDPTTYLETKYYESVFLIHMPLAYFVKSNLSRFKNMCKNTFGADVTIFYQTTLLRLLLRVKEFDKRHEGLGLLKSDINNEIMREKRDLFLHKHCHQTNDDLCHDMSIIVKVREIKLQIIILLEIIHLNKLDTNFADYESRYEVKLKKRSINLARRMTSFRRRNVLSAPRKCDEPALDYCEQLDIYLDKLCIQDLLLASEPVRPAEDGDIIEEHKKNMTNKNKECSSIGFVNFLLIPYYTKKAPNAVGFIIRKLKGPNLKNKKLSEKKASRRKSLDLVKPQETMTHQQPSSKVSATPSSLQRTNCELTFRRGLERSHVPELLASRTNSNLNELFETEQKSLRKPSLISRTVSDLTMNHLHKRQLPITDFSSHTSFSKVYTGDINSSGNPPSASKINASFSHNSFRRVGKVKNDQSSGPLMRKASVQDHIVQVESTPLVKTRKSSPQKRAKLLNIVESPSSNIDLSPTESKVDYSDNVLLTTTSPQKRACSKRNIKRRLFAP